MVAVSVAVAAGDITTRIQARLRMPAPATANTIVWQRAADRVILYIDSLKTKFLDGWLLCNVDLQSDATGRQTLQFVFFLGNDQDGSNPHGACTMNLATAQASQLADVWGADLRRILWDAVLDTIEAAVQAAATKKPGLPLTIQSFGCNPNGLQIAILAGA